MSLVSVLFWGLAAREGFDVHTQPFWMAVALVVIVMVYINVAGGRTIVDTTGIRSRRPLSRRTYPWFSIADVRVKDEVSRDGAQRRVVIRTVDGRERRLPAPGSFDIWHDPDFGARSAEIIQAWERQRATR